MAFVDSEKAFDSIRHEAVFKEMKTLGKQDEYISILRKKYREDPHRMAKVKGKTKQ